MSLSYSDTTSSYPFQTYEKKNIQQIRPWLYRPKKSKYGMRRAYKYNEQHWNPQQNQKYAAFLALYIGLFKSDPNRKRKYHLNRMASKFVGSRSPIQCRSHHQRMLKAYGTLQNIIREINMPQGAEVYSQGEVKTAQINEENERISLQQVKSLEQTITLLGKTKQQSFDACYEILDSQELMNGFFDL